MRNLLKVSVKQQSLQRVGKCKSVKTAKEIRTRQFDNALRPMINDKVA